MSSQLIDRSHPVLGLARGLSRRLGQLAEVPVWSMSPVEQREASVDLARTESQLAALRLRVLAEADRCGATDSEAAALAADWLAVETQQVRRAVRSDLNLARAIEQCPALGTATGRGDVNVPQARAIVSALDLLPSTGEHAVTQEQRRRAAVHLVDLAKDHDAKTFTILGRRIFDVIAPDLADAFEGKALADQEAAALRRTTFTMREDDEGTCHGRFRIPLLHGHILGKFLQALTSPTREGDHSIDPDQPTPVRHGLAFCPLLEAIPATSLPQTGGATATIVVTMTLDQLRSGLGEALLDTGTPMSPSQCRRLACNANLIPVVLGSDSAILDLGLTRRLFDRYQRLALALRDGGCIWPGCERTPAWCEAHHITFWADGGPTDLANGCLLCPYHHHLIHSSAGWQIHLASDGLPEVIPPVRLDPTRHPRRHERFQPRQC